MTIARARLALRAAIRDHLFDPNVGLIDFGMPEHEGQIAEDDLAIRIHVHKKLSPIQLEVAAEHGYTRPVPPVIIVGAVSFKTDVIQGTYRPHLWRWGGDWSARANLRTTRNDPLRGGISIRDERHIGGGTLGGKVIDRVTGAEMILSNWHVLVSEWRARPGQGICQPARGDGGGSSDTVATLTRDAMSFNLDAAVATLNGSRRLINDQLDLGMVTGVGQATLGMQLVKSGRTTGITHARVTAIHGTAKIPYDHLQRVILDVVTIEPQAGQGQPSGPGDSGSWWLNSATMEAIGLHFAGDVSGSRSLALDMPAVLDALNVDIAIHQETATSLQARRAPGQRPVVGFTAPIRGVVANASRNALEATAEVVQR